MSERNSRFFYIVGPLILLGLSLTSLYNYLLFHSLAEIFSIVVACGIFMLSWNARRMMGSSYLPFIGIAYLFIAALDLVHVLAYEGMGIFPRQGSNLATQLWIAARTMESVSLLISPFFLRPKMNVKAVFAVYAAACMLIFFSIFPLDLFPVCFLEGVGLTTFKKISEYIISFILLASIAHFFRRRNAFDSRVIRLMVLSIAVTIASELAFSVYRDVFGLLNMVGHCLKIVSFYLIYKAIIETGLVRPYDLLFRELEKGVAERTEELKRLSSRLLTAQEEERSRISRELHDGIGQTLSTITFALKNALRKGEEGKAAEGDGSIETVVPMLQDAIDEVRRISRDLHPPILDDLGILATLSWFCREFQKIHSDIRIEKRFEIDDDDVPRALKTMIYRIVQEAMNNVAKHSRADFASISLRKADRRIELLVEDNGRGFDVEHDRPGKGALQRFGLASMKERAELSSGSFVIEAAGGKGTRILVSWPLIDVGKG
ncbi:MASE3 domain-containing protein [Thermodesulfobacteriota bacterium]